MGQIMPEKFLDIFCFSSCASECRRMRGSARRSGTAGAEAAAWGSLLDRPRLLFNDTHYLSPLQLLPNVI